MFKIKFELKGNFEVTSMTELPSNFLNKIVDLGPDLIISDYVMPELDGIELLKAVKNDPRTMDIPFIFLTPDVFPILLEEGKKYGAIGIINPGVTHPQEVVDEVTRILTDLNK
jgi:CheY-like chemotaxis protein